MGPGRKESASSTAREGVTLASVGRDEAGIPRTPEAFGAELRRLRENAGVSLEDIVAETKIGIGVLRDLEAGRFSRLPERVFTRNFVRQFSEVVGFPPDTLAAWFDVAWEAHTLRSGSHPAIALAETPEPRLGRRLWSWIPVAIGIIVLLGVLLALVVRHHGQEEGDARHGAVPSLPVTSTPRSTPLKSSPPPISPSAVPLRESSDVDREDVRTAAATIRVLPGNECWIRWRDEHGMLSQRLLTAGESVEIPVEHLVQLTLGNGGGVVLTVGGKVYRAPGRPGEVVHLELHPDGMTRPENRMVEAGG